MSWSLVANRRRKRGEWYPQGGEILIFSTLLLDWGVKDPVPAPWAGKTPTLLVPSPTRPMSHWRQTKGKTNIQTTSNRRGGNFNAALITNPANVSPGE